MKSSNNSKKETAIKNTVLVVEDVYVNSLLVQEVLYAHGIKADLVKNGKEAIDYLKTNSPDLILLDIVMPKISGFDVCKTIKRNNKTKNIPIIFLTALEGDKNIRKGFELGAVDYITKPFKEYELLARVKTHLDLVNSKNELITELENKKKVEKALLKFSMAVEQSGNTIVITDTHGNITYTNPAFTKTTGYTKEEALGKNPRILKTETQHNNVYKELWETISDGKVWSGEFHNKAKNGSTFWEKAIISPIKNKNEETINYIAIKENITKKKQLEQNLLLSQETAKLGHYILNIKAGTWSSSRQLDTIFGIKKNIKNTIQNWFKVIHPDFTEEMSRYFSENILKKHENFNKTYKITDQKTGAEKWVHGLGNLKFDSDKNPIEMFGTIQDISLQKEEEKKLLEAEEKWQFAIDGSELGLWDWNIQTSEVFFSPQWKKMLGFTDNEIINSRKEWTNRIHPEDKQKTYDNINKHLAGKTDIYTAEYRLKTKVGSYIWVHDRGKLLSHTKDDNTLRMIGTLTDITEHKNLVSDLTSIKEFTENMLETANTIIVALDRNAKIIIFNKYAEQITGYSKNEVIDKDWFHIFIPEKDRPNIKTVFIDVLRKMPKTSKYENKIITKNNTELLISWNNSIISGSEDEIYGSLSFGRNITEEVKIEQELKESEYNFRNLINKSNDAIIMTSIEGKIIDVNEKAYEIFEYKKGELKGKPVSLINGKSNNTNREKILKQLKKDESTIFETTNISKSGKTIPVEVSASLIEYYKKEIVLSIIRDISERKQAEQKLLSAIIKTEEKERARIAQDLHDGLGPLMSTIKLYVQWAAKPDSKADKDTLLKKAEINIEEAYKSLRNISNNLSPHILNNFGLISAIKSFIDKVKDTTDIEIEFYSNLSERLGTVKETIIYRVLTEAINNTLKHAEASIITIEIKKEENKIHTSYSDNGIGFDIEKTLEAKKGQGLYNMQNRIKTLAGNIEIISNENKGININFEIKL